MTLSDLLIPLCVIGAYVFFVWFLWRETHGVSWSPNEPVNLRPKPRATAERVLFVCTHNSARSQMAEALLHRAAPGRFVVASAGTTPTHIHSLAARVMTEQGLPLTSRHAKSLAEVGTAWDYVITVCDAAFEQCPDFPVKTSRLHWSVKDPSSVTGSVDEQLDAFRQARDELSNRIEQWLADRLPAG
jgi:arsenate reductase